MSGRQGIRDFHEQQVRSAKFAAAQQKSIAKSPCLRNVCFIIFPEPLEHDGGIENQTKSDRGVPHLTRLRGSRAVPRRVQDFFRRPIAKFMRQSIHGLRGKMLAVAAGLFGDLAGIVLGQGANSLPQNRTAGNFAGPREAVSQS